jgi:hypothetical protein
MSVAASGRPSSESLAEIVDRILDKGLVIDVWARVSVVGIEILTVEARVVVASVDTFLHYAKNISTLEIATTGSTKRRTEPRKLQPKRNSKTVRISSLPYFPRVNHEYRRQRTEASENASGTGTRGIRPRSESPTSRDD